MQIITKKQAALTAVVALVIGLLGVAMAWRGVMPEAQAQTLESPFERARTRVCTNGLAEGRYAYTFTGSVVGLGTTTAVGVLTVKGDGTLVFADTQSLNGQISRRNFTGTYLLNADCTGSAVFSTGLTGDFVLGDKGNEIRVIITTPGTVISGHGQKL